MKKISFLAVVMLALLMSGCKGKAKELTPEQAQMVAGVTQKMTEDLGLNEDQAAKVKELNTQYLPQMMVLCPAHQGCKCDSCKCDSCKCGKGCCAQDTTKCGKPCGKECGKAQCDKKCDKAEVAKKCDKCDKKCDKAEGDKKCDKCDKKCDQPCEAKCDSMPTPEQIEAAKAAKTEYMAKMKEVLTAEQYTKFEAVMEACEQGHPCQCPQCGAAPAPEGQPGDAPSACEKCPKGKPCGEKPAPHK